MPGETYYWTRETQRGRKEAFWSNGELQLRVHGPMSHVNMVMSMVVQQYEEPCVPTGPPPKDAKLPDIHPGQTDLVEEIEKAQVGDACPDCGAPAGYPPAGPCNNIYHAEVRLEQRHKFSEASGA